MLQILMMNSYDMVKDVEGKLGFIADTNGLPNQFGVISVSLSNMI